MTGLHQSQLTMSDSHGPRITRVSMARSFKKLRNSFRRRKESYCISCGHVTRSCCHHEAAAGAEAAPYENVEFGGNKETKEDLLKWLDLDLSHGGINNNPAAVRLKYQVTAVT